MVRDVCLVAIVVCACASMGMTQQTEKRMKPVQKVIASGANVEADVAAIQRLRDKDIAASKAGDYDTLKSLFTADAVVMPPGSGFIRSAAERDVQFEGTRAAMANFEVLEYHEDFEELRILGDHAVEWGTIHGSMKDKKTGQVQSAAYKVMRVLRREPNGEWKILHSMFNDLPAGK